MDKTIKHRMQEEKCTYAFKHFCLFGSLIIYQDLAMKGTFF